MTLRWLRRTAPVVVISASLAIALSSAPRPHLAATAEPADEVAAPVTPGTPYYLALGDSLSQGVQPGATGVSTETAHGYVDDLFAAYSARVHGLQLEKLGCPGETTTTMIKGGVCPYPLGSQLAQATAFLRTHRVVLVTIDIGANNVDGCVGGGTVNAACVATGFGAAAQDLPAILAQLRGAAGPQARIAGMNYYDPFLAAWLEGAAGRALAAQSVTLTLQLNALLAHAYGSFGVPVADVQDRFQTTNVAVQNTPLGPLPVNVAIVCAQTWMCVPPPIGPNIHANAVGYAQIALAFEALGHRLPDR